ncbi:MAG: hypothetical protein IJY26_03405 [Clostridia bacterium]|nr:hypothetical protein [Clostridia bacterium]
MMKITKKENEILFPQSAEFEMQENTVQGARIGKKDNALYIVSPRRYKLFTDGTDFVKILEGNGFFKWKRGETKFSAGDCFEISEVGEYEINGNGTYIVVRN